MADSNKEKIKVYAVLDYEVTDLEAAPARTKYEPGQTAELTCQLKTSAGKADLHAIRINVTDPDGNSIEALQQVLLAPQGRATAKLPIALDDAPGIYKVTCTDAISGKKTTTEFSVSAD